MQDRSDGDVNDDVLIEIVDALEENGVDLDSNRLYDYIDPDVLEQLLESATGQVTISFTVDEHRVTVTPTTVVVSEHTGPETAHSP